MAQQVRSRHTTAPRQAPALTPAERDTALTLLAAGVASVPAAQALGRADSTLRALAADQVDALIARRHAWQATYLEALAARIDQGLTCLADPTRWDKMSAYQLAGIVSLLGSRHDEVLATVVATRKTAKPVLTLEEIRDARGHLVRRIARIEAQLDPSATPLPGVTAENGVVTPSDKKKEGEKS